MDRTNSERSAYADADMQALIVIDHGSRSAQSNEQTAAVANTLAERNDGRFVHVTHAHMESAEPGLDAAVAACVDAGARIIIVALYFLGAGRHASEDIPRLARTAALPYPGVEIVLTRPLGTHDAIGDLLLELSEEAVSEILK